MLAQDFQRTYPAAHTFKIIAFEPIATFWPSYDAHPEVELQKVAAWKETGVISFTHAGTLGGGIMVDGKRSGRRRKGAPPVQDGLPTMDVIAFIKVWGPFVLLSLPCGTHVLPIPWSCAFSSASFGDFSVRRCSSARCSVRQADPPPPPHSVSSFPWSPNTDQGVLMTGIKVCTFFWPFTPFCIRTSFL